MFKEEVLLSTDRLCGEHGRRSMILFNNMNQQLHDTTVATTSGNYKSSFVNGLIVTAMIRYSIDSVASVRERQPKNIEGFAYLADLHEAHCGH